MSTVKRRCSCAGLNPNCCRCDGWGYLEVKVRGYAKNLAIPSPEIDLASVVRGHEKDVDVVIGPEKATKKKAIKRSSISTIECFVCGRIIDKSKIDQHLLKRHNIIIETSQNNKKLIFKFCPEANRAIPKRKLKNYLKLYAKFIYG